MEAIEKTTPLADQFAAKSVDNREIWLATQQKTETSHPYMLCTNDMNIIEVYKESFVNAWNRAKTAITFGVMLSSLALILLFIMGVA